ncbi:hypothetical protein cyc_00983 [Cyclospora cayetanensis]|uniref:Uncharacterized protein n=1 Tax=Cyclospora cayetanensis TaxID=88456 RepID=A0A1D3D993_9EIME|nr:hypothetical protein cyc_00983 [Cyclospora cayetanensis]
MNYNYVDYADLMSVWLHRPCAVAELGVMVTPECLSSAPEGSEAPPVSLLHPRLRLALARETTITHGPPPALSLEEVSAVAMAAYEAKTSEEAAAADPSRSRPRLSLVEAVENVLTIRLSTDDKVQRSLAGVARTLQILQRQHQQRLHEELPESPLLRRVLRFGSTFPSTALGRTHTPHPLRQKGLSMFLQIDPQLLLQQLHSLRWSERPAAYWKDPPSIIAVAVEPRVGTAFYMQ